MLLLSVKESRARRALQREAARGRWPYRRLQLEIQRRLGLRRLKGGRPPPDPAGQGYGPALQQLLRLCRQLRDYFGEANGRGNVPVLEVVRRLDLAGLERGPLERLGAQLDAVGQSLAGAREALGGLEEALPGLLRRVDREVTRRRAREAG